MKWLLIGLITVTLVLSGCATRTVPVGNDSNQTTTEAVFFPFPFFWGATSYSQEEPSVPAVPEENEPSNPSPPSGPGAVPEEPVSEPVTEPVAEPVEVAVAE